MIRLTRTIRLAVTPSRATRPEHGGPRLNTFAAWPAPGLLAAWYEFDVTVVGTPEPETGYLLGIDVIDRVSRSAALPILEEAFAAGSDEPAAELLVRIAERIADELGPGCTAVAWRLTPRHEYTWNRDPIGTSEEPHMDRDTGPEITIRERFEFAAAHRLHCSGRSEEWNRETFGKCNNPRGHGHNYQVEVAVACGLDGNGEALLPIASLEAIVDQEIITRFDHRHLNEDCPEFADRNPSVENITMTCHELLDEPLAKAGGRLVSVTVWETGKTSCTYPVVGTPSPLMENAR